MLGRTLLTATLFALSSFTTAAAAPPGCLLGAVNTYADPADVKAVCQSKDAAQTIQKFCGDATKDALSAFADICMGAGVKVSTDMPKSSGSASATASVSGSASRTASGSKATGTAGSIVGGSSGNSTSPSMTGSTLSPSVTGAHSTATGGIAESTGAAGRMEIGVAAVLLGLFAVVL